MKGLLLAAIAAGRCWGQDAPTVSFDQGVDAAAIFASAAATARSVCAGRTLTPAPPRGPTPFAHGVLWRVASNGSVNYLFATQHTNDVRVTRLLGKASPFLAASRTVFTEASMTSEDQSTYSQSSLLPTESRLSNLVGRPLFDLSTELLKPYGIEAAQAERLQPWAAFNTLSRPVDIRSMLILDQVIADEAGRRGKPVNGIENGVEISRELGDISLSDQIEMLKDAACDYASNQADSEALTSLYAVQDIGGMLDYTLRYVEPPHVARFMERMVYGRSLKMADRLEPELRHGGVFAAVGGLHLTGKRGVLAMLSARGFDVRAVDLDDPRQLPSSDVALRSVRAGDEGLTLDGNIHSLIDPAVLGQVWSAMKKIAGAPAGLKAPRIHFDYFETGEEDLEWIVWTKNYHAAHPDAPNELRRGTVGWYFPASAVIQLSPSAFTAGYSINPQSGRQQDYGGFGYLEAGHEMAHYILEAKGEPFETQHQTMYCPGIDGGDAMIVKLADYLGSLNVGSADFLRSKIRFAMSFPGYECPAAGRTP